MTDSILNNLGFDPVFIILGMLVLILLLFIIVLVQFARTSSLNKKLDRFMRGKDAESLEDAFR